MNGIRQMISVLIAVILLIACGKADEERHEYTQFKGETMGTTYSVKHTAVASDLKPAVDSVLREVNMALSTYIPESVISQFNTAGSLAMPMTELSRHFERNVRRAMEIHTGSDGAFDPTVGPLINAWGFGWEGRQPEAPSQVVIDSLLQLVGMSRIHMRVERDSLFVNADVPGMKLDLSAIAKGYGVDAVAEFIGSLGISDYFVEIGGEVRTSGLNPNGSGWVVGISAPEEGASPMEFYSKVMLSGKSMATSGNYRNYYLINGEKVWHTIDPVTGKPELNPVLSVSVVADDCMTADALATACMVMGSERCIDFIEKYGAGAYLILSNPDGQTEVVMSGFDNYLIKK